MASFALALLEAEVCPPGLVNPHADRFLSFRQLCSVQVNLMKFDEQNR
jgi:hypothetical protein